MKISIDELAKKLGATVYFGGGPARMVTISGVAAVDKAAEGDVTFLVSAAYMKFAETTKAGAVIVGKIMENCPCPQIVHENPYWAFAIAFQMFVGERSESKKVDARAYVSPDAVLGENVTIYAGAFVSEGCAIGSNSVIFPGTYLGRGVKIGESTIVRANVVIEDGCILGNRVFIHGNTTIGADGFGFAPGKNDIAKIPQVGIVRIEDDVEIGAGSTVDRAAMGETLIARGAKLDSGVHIAHNVRIGEHTIVCGGACVAGSAKIGNWVILAGGTSISNHVEIGDRVVIGALAGVTKSLKTPGEYMGFPAMPANEWRREIASIRRIKSMGERISAIEQKLINSDKE
jgi:UDP-3-O-[3-hydroxymyristoyl] glucosamine N-acyltransferase